MSSVAATTSVPAPPDVRPGLGGKRWWAACTIAEAIGMTAAAGAARTADRLTDEVGRHRPAAALAIVVAGGLVEGVALGGLQAWALRPYLPGRQRVRWFVGTVLVAGLGWALAAAPSTLSGGGRDSSPPPVLLVLVGAGALGTVMGSVLGAVQSTALGGLRHGRRWIGYSALAWTPAMAVIFAGATAPDAGWTTPTVIALGSLTGAGAGLVLGLVTGALMPSLDGPSAHDRFTLAVLRLRAGRCGRPEPGGPVGPGLPHAQIPAGHVFVSSGPELAPEVPEVADLWP